MRLTDEELQANNDKSIALYKKLIEQGSLGTSLGIKVSSPPMAYRTVITPPCLPMRAHRKKINAMQRRTGPYSMSLAKEKTKYDHLIDEAYQDNTDYAAFDVSDGIGTFIPNEGVQEEKQLTVDAMNRGVLDL